MFIKDILILSTIDRLDAELLLAFVLNVDRAYIKAHPEYNVQKRQVTQFFRLMSLREQHVPLAYILGHKEFFGHIFYVNKHTLVPRPETELLVELVINDIYDHPASILIDVGTGSGCIPVSCYTTIKNTSLTVFATDISKKALRIARKNAKLYQVPITFVHGNLLEPIYSISPDLIFSKPLFITANLPYITHEQHQHETSISQEPITALVANEEGLSLYRELLNQLAILIEHQAHNSITLYLEIDPSQSTAIQHLIQVHISNASITLKKDLAGHDRLVRVLIAQK